MIHTNSQNDKPSPKALARIRKSLIRAKSPKKRAVLVERLEHLVSLGAGGQPNDRPS